MLDFLNRFSSRKAVFSLISIALNVIVPVLFKKYEVSETVTLTAMGGLSAITAAYIYGNVKAQKEGNQP